MDLPNKDGWHPFLVAANNNEDEGAVRRALRAQGGAGRGAG